VQNSADTSAEWRAILLSGNTEPIWEATLRDNLIDVGFVTKAAYLTLTVAALAFLLMLLLTSIHP
jgi:hypothetical protein